MKDKRTYIVRYGEVALKGMNKPYFERMLITRLRKVLKKFEGVWVNKIDGLVFVYTPLEVLEDRIITEISRVFGVASISPAIEVESDMDAIASGAVEYMTKLMEKRDIKTLDGC